MWDIPKENTNFVLCYYFFDTEIFLGMPTQIWDFNGQGHIKLRLCPIVRIEKITRQDDLYL